MSGDIHYRVNEPDVTFESFDSEVLAINLRDGSYYSLRTSAVPIWQMLAQGTGATATSRILARHTEAPESEVTAAVQDLVKRLETAGLIQKIPTPPDSPTNAPSVELPAQFVAPQLECYTDMKQLLLMDPIHEVDTGGWPAKAPGKHTS